MSRTRHEMVLGLCAWSLLVAACFAVEGAAASHTAVTGATREGLVLERDGLQLRHSQFPMPVLKSLAEDGALHPGPLGHAVRPGARPDPARFPAVRRAAASPS